MESEPGGLVSICLPTFNRPRLLKKALGSCFAQTYRNFEVLIGDDSTDEGSNAVVAEFETIHAGKIKYSRNIPAAGQNLNIDTLFKRANGERLVLLHDDDLLYPNALADLSACWLQTPELEAAFGLQTVIDMNGEALIEETRRTNEFYLRTRENFGLLKTPAFAGILRMFPNNGFMVLTKLAQKIGYRPRQEVGDECDYDFGLRLCLEARFVCLTDKYISAYRISDDAISHTSNDSPYLLQIIKHVTVPPEAEAARITAIHQFAPFAASAYARRGDGTAALRVVLSSDYAWRDRLSPRYVLHCLLTVAALVGGKEGVRFILGVFRGRVKQ